MNRPLVSVVIETITTRCGGATGSLPDDLAGTLNALDRQTYQHELIEHIVVLDHEVNKDDAGEVCRRYPTVKFLSSLRSHYLVAKNAGAAAASGEIIALVDGDCEPAPDWLEALVAPFDSDDVAAVAGRTHYTGGSWAARTFSVPDFAYILGEKDNAASGFNISNVAFRRKVLLAYPFDTRLPRNGGCYFLFHQLRADGARVLYEPRAEVAHAFDYRGRFGFVRKHFDRGYDGLTVYRLDDREVLRGTRLLRRLGALGLVAITGRRIVVDWLRLVRHHRQIGIPVVALPYFGAVGLVTRLIELTGGLAAVVAPRSSR